MPKLKAEETGHVAKVLVTLLPLWWNFGPAVIISFPSFQTIFGKKKDPVMIHQHMETRENYIHLGRNLFDLSGMNLPKFGH